MFTCPKCGEQWESLFNAMSHERRCNGGLVEKIKKGDRFYKGTSPTVYTALTDESARGWVSAVAWDISVGAKIRLNTNQDALTIIKEEEPVVAEEPSYMMFARANVRDGLMTTPSVTKELLARIDRLEKEAGK